MNEDTRGNVRDIKYMDCQFKDLMVAAFDTETPGKIPSLLTMSTMDQDRIFDVKPENIFDIFLAACKSIDSKYIVMFAHNLYFDMTVLLNQALELFLDQEFIIEYNNARISFFNDNPFFGEVKFKNGQTVHLRDTFAFFGAVKLNELAKSLDLLESKMDIPEKWYNDPASAKNKKFRDYAIQDTRLTVMIGQRIMDFHEMEGIPLCISGPQMSMTVFKKKFMPFGGVYPSVHGGMKSWELSYHGGKNGCYVKVPCRLKNVRLYDINSAYPYAMTLVPNFLNCEYKRKKDLTAEGIFQISAKSKCFYNSTFEHDFTPTKKLDKVWITSYELRSLLKHKELDSLKVYDGWIIKESGEEYNPLKEFALHYYALKQNTPKNTPLYLYYKICMLNALYGKFIERRYPQGEQYSIRGPNYNPAIASLITGYTRAYLHDLEHQSEAIHSATDSVFTQQKMETSKELGGISLEGVGDLILLRTKLYLFYNKNGDLLKKALHGFHGTIETLEQMIESGNNEYTYEKIPRVKEYFKNQNLHLHMFGKNRLHSSINVDVSNITRYRVDDNNLNGGNNE